VQRQLASDDELAGGTFYSSSKLQSKFATTIFNTTEKLALTDF